MLTHPTHGRLVTLGLTGMAKALDEQQRQPDIATLAFEERLALLVDREATERENKRLVSRLRFASLRQNAAVEDIDMKAPRGLDKALFQKLVAGEWIERYQNLLIIGPTGVGKSWIACALGHKACRDNCSVLYQRLPRLFDVLALARGDGHHARLLKSLARVELLILGTGSHDRRAAARPLGDHGGSARARIDHGHQPASGRALARDHRRSYPRRCHS